METLNLQQLDRLLKRKSTSDEMIHKNVILLFLLQLVSGNSNQWAGHLHAGYSTKNMTLDRNLSVEHEFLFGWLFISFPNPLSIFHLMNNQKLVIIKKLKLLRIKFINVDK